MAEEIRAELVATVGEVVVGEGDVVAPGDTLVVLESMKMEIPVLTEQDGTVTRLAVEPGALVRAGDLLAVVEHNGPPCPP
ncbi:MULTISPECIES: biotin/lipoyl-binding carrier protein [unclassified Crossiella]|uniref:biotin/lipoyl-binding carrier protein n=1 Tax=unclassified Crossiella TaxID=2620835 RepID=UPI001FFE6BCC|nr:MULTISPECIES: biotin/lipoyl-binding carrier protein [unclassified Crossiella]MCK2243922.1 biotin/lipoyl-binding carrier protein [Crossiella sp. S99.2]MCK2257220.1 biotin/lipoyl-binding carrier protein [Crossiella sp. S99.1]